MHLVAACCTARTGQFLQLTFREAVHFMNLSFSAHGRQVSLLSKLQRPWLAMTTTTPTEQLLRLSDFYCRADANKRHVKVILRVVAWPSSFFDRDLFVEKPFRRALHVFACRAENEYCACGKHTALRRVQQLHILYIAFPVAEAHLHPLARALINNESRFSATTIAAPCLKSLMLE